MLITVGHGTGMVEQSVDGHACALVVVSWRLIAGTGVLHAATALAIAAATSQAQHLSIDR
jgi:hypothetical protein